ncbi:MAG: DUF4160 domain-containing protein [Bacteriovoracaceae bacterium]|nr:DUF4160 domain-containing protein [Bacteriovoracaceae bacterium]
MPEVSRFYGIVISILWSEHNPPHFHATYGEYRASFDIKTLAMKGSFPATAKSLVRKWARPHQEELLKMWNKRKAVKLPPLV